MGKFKREKLQMREVSKKNLDDFKKYFFNIEY